MACKEIVCRYSQETCCFFCPKIDAKTKSINSLNNGLYIRNQFKIHIIHQIWNLISRYRVVVWFQKTQKFPEIFILHKNVACRGCCNCKGEQLVVIIFIKWFRSCFSYILQCWLNQRNCIFWFRLDNLMCPYKVACYCGCTIY